MSTTTFPTRRARMLITGLVDKERNVRHSTLLKAIFMSVVLASLMIKQFERDA